MKSISRRSLFGISAAALIAPLLPKQAEAEQQDGQWPLAEWHHEWHHPCWSYSGNTPQVYRTVVPDHPHRFPG